jgi:hypothetical protein
VIEDDSEAYSAKSGAAGAIRFAFANSPSTKDAKARALALTRRPVGNMA